MVDRSTEVGTKTQERKPLDPDKEATDEPVTITAGEARQAEIILDTNNKKITYLIVLALAMIGLVITYFVAAG